MNDNIKEVVIVSAVRTPIGAYKGSLKNIRPDQLGSIVIKGVLNKSNFSKEEIDEVILGQVLTAGNGQNPARQASIKAGIPVSKPAHLINQVCGSGLRAVISGYQSIKLGEAKNIISGGQENMSIAPHSIFYREKKEILEEKLVDTMINDGLIDAFNNYHMGVTAENVAKKFDISREEQDDFALNSQKKAQNAIMNAFGQPIEKDRKVRFGADSTHMPDFLSMTSVGSTARGQDSMNKPYGDVASGSPFKESYEDTSPIVPPRLTYDMVKTLSKMQGKINVPKHTLLNEREVN